MELSQLASTRYGLRSCGIAANAIGLAFLSTDAPAAPEVAPAVKAQVQSNYGKLPLSFEANQGQTDAQVKFLSRGQGYALFLTPTEAVLSLKKPGAQPKASSSPAKSTSAPEATGAVLRMQLAGANPAPRIIGKNALPGRVNYFIGKDPSRWHTGVPTYARVAYEGVYPGVDLVYYGNQRQLEYDFVVTPGADPHNIKLAFLGADKIEASPTGELILRTASGDLRMHKPIVYQEVNGARKRIDGGYMLKDAQAVGFQVGAYDAARPLVIDPVLVYSTYLGGSGFETGQGIAVDRRGRAYVTGFTGSSDFPTHNALQPAFGGGDRDVFVAQLTADGAALRYSTYLGGSGSEAGQGIAIDRRGQASVTGITDSSDFPTHNAPQPAFGGDEDAFVAKLTADGAALRYSTYLGGSGFEAGQGIAVDHWGQASVTGFTTSFDFPTRNALQPAFGGGGFDAFVANLTADGAALRYSTYLGGSGFDEGVGIAVDQRGQASVAGITDSSDFPTHNAPQTAFGGGDFDAFVTQLTADGAALRYSTYLGGSGLDEGVGIAVDRRGQASVAGFTDSSDFPTHNALQPVFGGDFDAFVAQLTADGAALRYSTYLGGSGFEAGQGIAVDHWGQASVTGFTGSSDFPTHNALQPAFGGGGQDAFVAQLTADGAAPRYSTYLGGSGFDEGVGIAVDRRGQAYVTGSTGSSDFPTHNALQPAYAGNGDVFVTKIGSNNRP